MTGLESDDNSHWVLNPRQAFSVLPLEDERRSEKLFIREWPASKIDSDGKSLPGQHNEVIRLFYAPVGHIQRDETITIQSSIGKHSMPMREDV